MKKYRKLKNCVFCELIENRLSPLVFENDNFVIINDIRPDAKKHYLAIPKNHFTNLLDAEMEDFDTMNEIMKYVAQHANELGVGDGFRLVMNNGEQATQTVFHAHMHFLGGQKLKHTQSNL